MADPPNVTIPDEERAAQAIHAIRGYVYQIYATALAWTRLQPGETLHVECGSDYLQVAAESLTGVEVKAVTSATATLRAAGVVSVLNRFWRLRAANPGHRVQLIYLSTQTIGREAGLAFPGAVPGLDYWRLASREGVDVTPLRSALGGLDLNPQMLTWIAAVPDEALREELLRPIRFECGQPPLAQLAEIVGDTLADVGATIGLPPSDARRAVSGVLLRLITLAATDGERAVTAGELRAFLEEAGTSRIANSHIAALLAPKDLGAAPTAVLAPKIAIALSEVPMQDLVVDRSALVDRLAQRLSVAGVLWLTGASGLGKSGLALQTASRSRRAWSVVELGGQDDAAAERMRQAQRLIGDPRFGGLILDDLPAGLSRTAQTALQRLVAAARLAGGGVIVTAYQPPPPTLAAQLALPPEPSLEAPYFSEEEVATFVSAEGGDPAFWARATFVFSMEGFPQLVAARIRGLKARAWPQSAISEGTPFTDEPAEDVEAERASVRARLIQELPAAAATMLYRASIPVHFDRRLAMALADIDPPVAAGGAALEVLLGPWIERRGVDRLRVSPLVADIGEAVLSAQEKLAVHRAVSKALSAQQPLNASMLGQLFVSALVAKNPVGLRTIAGVVIMSDAETRALLSDALFVLRLVRLDAFIFAEDLELSRLLRLAQVKLCVRAEDPSRALPAFERLLVEIVGDPKAESLRMAGVAAILVPADIGLGPEVWFAIVRGLEGLPDVAGGPWAGDGEGPLPGGSPSQFMFLWRATQMRSIGELETLIGLLDAAGPEIRRMYIDGLEDPYASQRAMIQAPWVAEAALPDFDPGAAADRYLALQRVMERWGETSFVVECIASRTVLLAEYALDLPAALAVLDSADPRLAGEARIRRERAKLQGRLGEDAAVVVTLTGLLHDVPPQDRVERIHVLRDLAVSAARLPEKIFVARSAFKSTREATKEMLRHSGRPYFDWIIRDGSLWSFRDPRTGPMAEVIDVDTVEAVETEVVALPDDPDDENAVIDLLRRSVEAQLYDQLVFDKDSRALYFRAEAAGKARTYPYRSLQQATSAEVVKLIKKQGREDIMRHHAFTPRYQRLGDGWFISIQPTFVFTADGHRPHPASSLMLSGKKKLEKEGAVRGQIIMWRHLLIESGQPASGLFEDPDRDTRARIQFVALEPVALPISVPEEVWKKDDPNAENMVVAEGLL